LGSGRSCGTFFPQDGGWGCAPANFAYYVRELGGGTVEPVTVSSVGPDEPGQEILARWRKLSLNADFLATDPDHPTGMVNVTVDPQGIPAYEIVENAAWDFLPERPRLQRLAESADAVCFGTLAQRSTASRNSIRGFLRQARPSTLRILDISLREPFFSRETVEDSLSSPNVLKINIDALRVLAGFFPLSGEEKEVFWRG
jgi:fructokinase